MQIRPVEDDLLHEDRQTDIRNKASSIFSNFVAATKTRSFVSADYAHVLVKTFNKEVIGASRKFPKVNRYNFYVCRCSTSTAVRLFSIKRIKQHKAVTYLHTTRCRVFLEKLPDLQPVKKFPTFYGTRLFITTFTSARYLSLS